MAAHGKGQAGQAQEVTTGVPMLDLTVLQLMAILIAIAAISVLAVAWYVCRRD
jgi:hypothetical protein